jgi:hypothetical protein
VTATSPCPENSEAINYANWYAYYSTRLNAAKSTTATAFSFLTNVPPDPIAYRVGFHNLGEEPIILWRQRHAHLLARRRRLDQTQRNLWYANLFGISVNNFKTPIMDAMLRIGDLLENKGVNGLPAQVNPLPAGTKDIIAKKPDNTLISCQNNYHILFTDGKNNQVSLPAVATSRTPSYRAASISFRRYRRITCSKNWRPFRRVARPGRDRSCRARPQSRIRSPISHPIIGHATCGPTLSTTFPPSPARRRR